MKTVMVDLDERSYRIRIGDDVEIFPSLSGRKGTKALIVTDSNVEPLYGHKYSELLAGLGIAAKRLVLPAGENTKTLKNVEKIYEAALDHGLDRSSVFVALGGGVVGDIAGFAAATYMRGVKLIQVPTTLLAMVDSSVGGKTAVNLPRGKNMIGAFYQPIEVTASLGTLETLPEKEYRSGLAEVVKYGIIWDASLFKKIEKNIDKMVARNAALLEHVVARCCEIKAEIVAMDERDAGVRAILNFGHTLGHALETVTGYGSWLHGEAVSIGMVFAARISAMTRKFPAEDEQRIKNILSGLGLPISPACSRGMPKWHDLQKTMECDKKAAGGKPRFVLVKKLGSVVYGCEVPDEIQKEAFNTM